MSKKSFNRRKTRQVLVQALYSWLLSGENLVEIEAHFYAEQDMKEVDREFFKDIFYGVAKQKTALEDMYRPYLDRELDDLDPISRAILGLSSYEMVNRIDVPYKVVINEGVNLAKAFGPTDAYKFINGVLDQLAISQRAVEVAATKR